jgi:hypothetical protein
MQGDDLMANEVVPRSDILGEPNGRDASGEKVVLDPFSAVGFPADFVDLEPLGVCLVELVASNGSTGSHICQHGTNVVRPRAITSSPPVESDSVAGIGSSGESSWTGVGAACKRRVVGTLVRILGADLANDAGVGGTTCTVALEYSALNGYPPEKPVGGDVGGSQEGSEEDCGELHCIARGIGGELVNEWCKRKKASSSENVKLRVKSEKKDRRTGLGPESDPFIRAMLNGRALSK